MKVFKRKLFFISGSIENSILFTHINFKIFLIIIIRAEYGVTRLTGQLRARFKSKNSWTP